MYRILCVCTGNICRSPMAEGILRDRLHKAGLSQSIQIDSAGIQGYHVGESPDIRAQNVAKHHGIDLKGIRSRRFNDEDFELYDMIFAMDMGHYKSLQMRSPANANASVELFLEYAGCEGCFEVPDPYYGTSDDFEDVFQLLAQNTPAVIAAIQEEMTQCLSSTA